MRKQDTQEAQERRERVDPYVIKYYPDNGAKRIAEMLGESAIYVRNRARRLGIRVSPQRMLESKREAQAGRTYKRNPSLRKPARALKEPVTTKGWGFL